MSGIKRKGVPSDWTKDAKKQKKITAHSTTGPTPAREELEDFSGSDEDEKNDDFAGFSEGSSDGMNGVEDRSVKDVKLPPPTTPKTGTKQPQAGPKQFKLETSSAEAHAKQRALAQERKASKPNADAIQRSKKIWERLRRKSHVPPDERKELVAELFSIITGRVRDFVFKHDSVRVIQCALKYANQEQRRQIAQELKGDVRPLAESRYGKFLVAKMVQDRDEQIRDAIIPEFYGHVRRLINHPEASWIVDDIYRQIATPVQKAMMLREWYGAEFALFHKKAGAINAAVVKHEDTADITKTLEASPEKRRPILQYLLQMINSLIQKKMTGFTMLHDAMLQYFLALTPGSAEQTEFLEVLKGDIDPESEGGGGDLFRNLSFTRSGSRLVCLALAHGSAKDRKTIIRCFKDTVEMMAYDQYAKMVLVVGLDVPDDTKMSSKSVFPELLGQGIQEETQRLDRLVQIVTNINARLPILYPLAGLVKWLFNDTDKAILEEVHEIRNTTTKKDPEVRRQELLAYMSAPLLELVSKRAENLVQSSFGCQFITETLLETQSADKSQALAGVAQSASGDPTAEDHIAMKPAAGRMLKRLVLGGNFDAEMNKVTLVDPPLKFGLVLFSVIERKLIEWACGDSSFVVVAFLESEDVPESVNEQVRNKLKNGMKKIEAAANGDGRGGVVAVNENGKKKRKIEGAKGNAGAKMLLEKIG